VTVDATAVRNFALAREGRWLVAVSGGGDSVALLRMLGEGPWVVGYFNHQWGEFGAQSGVFVRALAQTLGLPFVYGCGNGKAATNAEAAARAERYAWFAKVCAEQELSGVLVAHTRTDVAEGFLMRAGKGGSARGLAALAADGMVDGVRVVRPLLAAGREELRDYLRALGQDWLEDPDNDALGSQRARVRALLPKLAEVGIGEEGLAAAAASLREADEALDAWVDGVDIALGSGWVAVEREALVNLPAEIAVRVLARLMEAAGHTGMMVRRSKRMALWQRICQGEAGVATLGEVRVEWDGTVRMARLEG